MTELWRPGLSLEKTLAAWLREQIRQSADPRFVSARIVHVTDRPRTRSGNLTELAIHDVIQGCEVKNVDAIANPEALDQCRGRAVLVK